MVDDGEFLKKLRARGPAHFDPPYAPQARAAFAEVVQPVLARLGVSCELLETYTVARRCDALEIEGRRYILFDHALLDCFALLDWVSGKGAQPSFTAAALMRVFAEAAREAQRLDLYAFYLRRAAEIAPLVNKRPRTDLEPGGVWRVSTILFHEGAHSLSKDHEVRRRLEEHAQLRASDLMNELIAGLTGQLLARLGEKGPSPALRADLDRWQAARDDLNIGDEAIFATFEATGTDPRFLDEVACDSFAVAGLRSVLLERSRSYGSRAAAEMTVQAFVAAYRAFLHLRLLQYVDDVMRELQAHMAADHLDPLKLRLLVESSFRGNLFVQQLLDVAEELGGVKAARRLRDELEAVQSRHSEQLVAVAGEVMERTILDPGFHRQLGEMLEADGVNLQALNDDPLAVLEADEIWLSLHGSAAAGPINGSSVLPRSDRLRG